MGCSHGDEKCKYDSKWPGSYAEAYVKLQLSVYSLMYGTYSLCMYIYYYVNSDQMLNHFLTSLSDFNFSLCRLHSIFKVTILQGWSLYDVIVRTLRVPKASFDIKHALEDVK